MANTDQAKEDLLPLVLQAFGLLPRSAKRTQIRLKSLLDHVWLSQMWFEPTTEIGRLRDPAGRTSLDLAFRRSRHEGFALLQVGFGFRFYPSGSNCLIQNHCIHNQNRIFQCERRAPSKNEPLLFANSVRHSDCSR
jgi:hypothetical protein